MLRTSNQNRQYRRTNYLSTARSSEGKQDNIVLDDYVHGKELIEKKLREINENIEVIGKICDRKKQRSYEEYNNVLNSNKAMIEEELSKIRFKLVDALKNSTREDLLKKLQKDFTNKKSQVYDTDREIQNKNKILYDYEHKINKLKEENRFLNQEIKNSHEYQLYLQNKIKELEEGQKNKVNSVVNMNTTEQAMNSNNRSQNMGDRSEEAEKLKKYFEKNEEMIKNKLLVEDKAQKYKYHKYKSLTNFKNPIQEILRSKIRKYQINQMNQMTEKVTNQEVFFNLNESKDCSKSRLSQSNLTTLKNKNNDGKLNNKDKKEIIKMFLEDEEMKQIIFSFLYE